MLPSDAFSCYVAGQFVEVKRNGKPLLARH
jgi:hypothetical protein